MKNDIAWDFEEEVADEKDACTESVDGIGELQILKHLKFGKADVDAVDIGDDVTDEQDGHQTPGDPRVGFLFNRFTSDVRHADTDAIL